MFFSKKILIVGVGILILFIGVGIGLKMGKVQSLHKTVQETSEAGSQNKFETSVVKIVRVIDGDTIEIEGGEKVRYIGIDAPETVDPRTPVQCFGVEASNKNKELVEGKMARLEKDITERDKYGRLLRYVWVGDVFVNLELVKQGFAYSYSYPPDIKYQDLFVEAQQGAREAKRGLWNSCPAVAPAGTQIPVLPVINAKNYYGLIRANKGIVK